MITKAGVPSNKVAVGVTSYARSFQMTTSGCYTEECKFIFYEQYPSSDCFIIQVLSLKSSKITLTPVISPGTFTGPLSGAIPGPCTETAGYVSDYELSLILASEPSAVQMWDANSYSNILVYEQQTNWAGYMSDTNKLVRKALYSDLLFLGTADWAVDLQSDDGTDLSSDSGSDSDRETVYIDPAIWSSASALVTALPGVTLIWPPMPLPTTTTISFPLWTTFVSVSSLTTSTSTAVDGSVSTFPYIVWVTIDTIITIPQGSHSSLLSTLATIWRVANLKFV